MTNRFSPRDLMITLKGAYEAPDWTAYLVGKIAEKLGGEETVIWWSEADEHEWFEFFQAILSWRLGEKHAQREWERLINFWLEHRSISLSDQVEIWQAKTTDFQRQGISTTTFLDPDYPPEFIEIDEPPAVLWSTQPLKELAPRRLAVVGSRNMTAHGARSTRDLVGELAGNYGFGIVSGCARGIDWVAHATAMKAGSQTVGILGCGIEKMPYYCRELAQNPQVIWISEFSPQVQGAKWRFPFRNRLIAALSRALLVIEGGPHSGTLITAKEAIDLGREVMVLSASGYNKNTEVLQKFSGCSTARIVVTLENILDYLEIAHRKGRRSASVLLLAENKTEKLFLRQLMAHGGRILNSSLRIPDCIDSETWENTRFELEARGIITERLGTCELAGMVQS